MLLCQFFWQRIGIVQDIKGWKIFLLTGLCEPGERDQPPATSFIHAAIVGDP